MRRKLCTGFAIILIFFATAAAFTNPSKPQYINWVKERIINESNGGLAGVFTAWLAPTIIDGTTQADNYLLFTVYKTKIGGAESIVLGAFNHFFGIREAQVSQQNKTLE
jgi:hypothetical protein